MSLTTVDQGLLGTYAQYTGFKNRIINGAMVIDQRNAGASVTPTTSGYTLDRWNARPSVSSKFSVQQNAGSVTPPAGFTNYLGVTSLSAYSAGSSDYFGLSHAIEGYNVADFGWGSASAATVTLSFWVRSSLTGTFGGSVYNSTSARSYVFSYTINSANTWEQKTITIVGDTSGTWLTNNSTGLVVWFSLGAGSNYTGTANTWSGSWYAQPTGATSVVGTNGATFYITGVQLEKGSTATSFDYRPYGTELALCQRYYEKSFNVETAPANGSTSTSVSTGVGMVGGFTTNNSISTRVGFATAKRATPTITKYGNNSGYWKYYPPTSTGSASWDTVQAGYIGSQGTSGFCFSQNIAANTVYVCEGHWVAEAEL